MRIGCLPYYIFQCRPVKGVKGGFQVPLRDGMEIVEAAKAMQNGHGKHLHYCLSHPTGKIETPRARHFGHGRKRRYAHPIPR